MRPLVRLLCVLTALAAPATAPRAGGELDSHQQQLALELQQRIDRDVRVAVEAALRAHAPGAPDAFARPARMNCRSTTGYALECVVVSKRPGAERVARSR
jgi:hypothetical protein